MFNKKLKQELETYKKELNLCQETIRIQKLAALKQEEEKKSLKNEIEKLEKFNEKIELKLEELLKPEIDYYIQNAVFSQIVGVSLFDRTVKTINSNYNNLEDLCKAHEEQIKLLQERDEENKKLLFLSARVEQLINKLNSK